MGFPGEDITIASYLIRNPDVLGQHESSLEQYPFSNAFIRWVFAHLKQAWVQNRKRSFPSQAEALIYIDKMSAELPEVHRTLLGQATQKIYKTEVTTVTADRVVDYLIKQRSEYLQDVIEDLDPLKLQEAETLLHELRVIRDSPLAGGIANSSPFSERAISAQEEEDSSWNQAIPLGFPLTDEMLRGGLRAGELFILVAPTGKGKSMFLISSAIDMAKRGYRILYVALDNPLHEMELRAQESALGLSKFSIGSNVTYGKHLRKSISENWGKLDPSKQFYMVSRQDFASKPTAHDIQAMATAIEMSRDLREYDLARGTMPDRVGRVDAIVVDYGDRMRPEYSSKGAQRYERLAEISENLQEIAIISNRPVITASQVNRTGYGLDDPDLSHLAGSFDKAAPAGLIGILCQTDEEETIGRFRIAFTKLRRGVQPFEVHYGFNRDITRVWELPDKPKALSKRKTPDKKRGGNSSGQQPQAAPVVLPQQSRRGKPAAPNPALAQQCT